MAEHPSKPQNVWMTPQGNGEQQKQAAPTKESKKEDVSKWKMDGKRDGRCRPSEKSE